MAAVFHITEVTFLQFGIHQILKRRDKQLIFAEIPVIRHEIHRNLSVVKCPVVLLNLLSIRHLWILRLNLKGVILPERIYDTDFRSGHGALHLFHQWSRLPYHLLQLVISAAGITAVRQNSVPVLLRPHCADSPAEIHHRIGSVSHRLEGPQGKLPRRRRTPHHFPAGDS